MFFDGLLKQEGFSCLHQRVDPHSFAFKAGVFFVQVKRFFSAPLKTYLGGL